MEKTPLSKLSSLKGNTSIRRFAEKVGLSEKTIRNLLSGEAEFSRKVSETIARAYGLPENYFLNEDLERSKDQFKNNPAAADAYDKYIESLRQALSNALERRGMVAEAYPGYGGASGVEIRLVGQMPAGLSVDMMDEEPVGPSLYLPFKDCKGAVGFTVLGDSMEDQYHDGDIVIVKPRPLSQVIHEGHTYCVDYEIDGKLHRAVKDVYRSKDGYRLRSKNGRHPDIEVKDVVRFFRIIREIRGFTHELA